MNDFKFVHCADIHLDIPLTGLRVGREVLERRREDLRSTLTRIFEVVKMQKADALFIAGDLYEHNYIKKGTADFIKKTFETNADIPIYICAGNHDPFIQNSLYTELKNLPNVTIFGEAKKVQFPQKNVVIYGEGFTDFYKNAMNLEEMDHMDKRKINILLTHGSINIDLGKNKYNPVIVPQLQSLEMDYIAIGHFHSKSIHEELVYNPGSPEPLGFDEPGGHGVFVVSLSKEDGILDKKVEFIKINTRNYFNVEVDITGCESSEECAKKIKISLGGCTERDFIKVILTGNISRELELDLERIKRKFADYFYFTIENKTFPDFCFEDIILDRGIKGEFARKMFEEIRGAKDEAERANLLNALYIGIETIERGSVEIERYFKVN